MPSNPIHFVIETLTRFIDAVWQCHHAETKAEKDQRLQTWLEAKKWFWPRFHRPAEAIRGLGDPALAWCSQRGFRSEEHFAIVETAVRFAVHLAMLTCPVANPYSYKYHNEADAKKEWEKEGDFLLEAICAKDALRRLAAVTGDDWQPSTGGGAGEGSQERATVEPGEGLDDEQKLTDRQGLILETMLESEITSERRRKTRARIVKLVNPNLNPKSCNHDFAALVKLEYLQVIRGPSGGLWLTLRGRTEAQRLRQST